MIAGMYSGDVCSTAFEASVVRSLEGASRLGIAVAGSESASYEGRFQSLQVALREAILHHETQSVISNGAAAGQLFAVGLAFLSAMPISVGMPDVDLDFDGDLRFEWIGGPRSRVLVTLSSDNVLHFAILSPAGKVNGSEIFVGHVPEVVRAEVEKLQRVDIVQDQR